MKTRLLIASLCNIVDTVSTLYLYNMGYKELNPIMALLLNYPPLFVIVKLGAMYWVVSTIWKEKDSRAAILLSWYASILYSAIAVYYIVLFVFYL